MSDDTASVGVNILNAGTGDTRSSRALKSSWRGLSNFFGGLAILFVVWWFGVYLISSTPSTEHFADFGPIPAFQAMPELWDEGTIQSSIMSSGYRLGSGLLIAIIIGVPIGILMVRSKRFRELSNSPFQLLRMISPLAWEPIAV
ncbi:MAG: ABC transporter permease, partial [Candidatus Thiodiazotropha sp. (ex Lucinoma borealis)]|nr:ABC transporter permease [Candidatus Thiodiazotropha sp. (ex Lucinoma borealis)]